MSYSDSNRVEKTKEYIALKDKRRLLFKKVFDLSDGRCPRKPEIIYAQVKGGYETLSLQLGKLQGACFLEFFIIN